MLRAHCVHALEQLVLLDGLSDGDAEVGEEENCGDEANAGCAAPEGEAGEERADVEKRGAIAHEHSGHKVRKDAENQAEMRKVGAGSGLRVEHAAKLAPRLVKTNCN